MTGDRVPLLDRVPGLDRSGFSTGVPVGPLLVVVGYAILTGSGVTVDDTLLWVVVTWPVLPPLVLALLLPRHRRWWLALAVGCVAGTVFTVVAVVGIISGLAYVLSDPAGRP